MIGNKNLPEYKNKYEDKKQPIATPRKKGRPKKSEVGIAKPTAKKRGRPPKSNNKTPTKKTPTTKVQNINIEDKILGKKTTKSELDYMFENKETKDTFQEDPITEVKIDNLNILEEKENLDKKEPELNLENIENYRDTESKKQNSEHKEAIYLTIITLLCIAILIVIKIIPKH